MSGETPSGSSESRTLLHRAAHALAPLLRLLARKGGSEYFDPVEFLRFCCQGLANTLLDFCVYFAVSYVMPLFAARIVSWAVATSFSYVFNKRWVFRAEVSGGTPILRFTVVNVASLLFGLAMMQLFVWLGWGRFVAYLVTLPAIALGNYFGYKLWSFKEG